MNPHTGKSIGLEHGVRNDAPVSMPVKMALNPVEQKHRVY